MSQSFKKMLHTFNNSVYVCWDISLFYFLPFFFWELWQSLTKQNKQSNKVDFVFVSTCIVTVLFRSFLCFYVKFSVLGIMEHVYCYSFSRFSVPVDYNIIGSTVTVDSDVWTSVWMLRCTRRHVRSGYVVQLFAMLSQYGARFDC